MKLQHPLFSQVVLAQDLPEYHLKRGDAATIVEYYSMPDGEDGYSLEGFNVPDVTIEVAASRIVSIAQWRQEQTILAKLRQLSQAKQSQLEDYLDFLLQKENESKIY